MADDDVERVWALAKSISICMLATRDGDEIRSRPMGAYIRPEEHAVYFLTDVKAHKDDEIRQFPNVCMAFADASGQKYVSITGRAEVSNDRSKIKELWGMVAKAWWNSPEDPNIRVLKVAPNDAEYWDSPGTVVSYIKMAAAAVSNTRPAMGDNKKVAL